MDKYWEETLETPVAQPLLAIEDGKLHDDAHWDPYSIKELTISDDDSDVGQGNGDGHVEVTPEPGPPLPPPAKHQETKTRPAGPAFNMEEHQPSARLDSAEIRLAALRTGAGRVVLLCDMLWFGIFNFTPILKILKRHGGS